MDYRYKLDQTLRVLHKRRIQHIAGEEVVKMGQHELDKVVGIKQSEGSFINRVLKHDGLIDTYRDGRSVPLNGLPRISIKGIEFIDSGGYEQQMKDIIFDQKIKQRTIKWFWVPLTISLITLFWSIFTDLILPHLNTNKSEKEQMISTEI